MRAFTKKIWPQGTIQLGIEIMSHQAHVVALQKSKTGFCIYKTFSISLKNANKDSNSTPGDQTLATIFKTQGLVGSVVILGLDHNDSRYRLLFPEVSLTHRQFQQHVTNQAIHLFGETTIVYDYLPLRHDGKKGWYLVAANKKSIDDCIHFAKTTGLRLRAIDLALMALPRIGKFLGQWKPQACCLIVLIQNTMVTVGFFYKEVLLYALENRLTDLPTTDWLEHVLEVHRHQHPTFPPTVFYCLSDKIVLPILGDDHTWIVWNVPKIESEFLPAFACALRGWCGRY